MEGSLPALASPASTRRYSMLDDGKDDSLDRAFDGLEHESPDRISRAIHSLRDQKARWIRLPLGIAFIVASFFWFLPVAGIEMLPIGLLLIAQDVPCLRRPVGRMVCWLEHKWVRLRGRFRR